MKRDLKYDYHINRGGETIDNPMPKKFKTIKFRCQNAECNRIYTVKHSKIIPCPFCGKEENFRSKFRDPKKDYEKIPKVSTVIIQPT
ncbi:MAG: hypothetical protein AABY22_05020, partial [Nanoarchaeota archaeon]